MKRLQGKSALVTGSARGIGRAFAQAYISEGATVAIADINLERAQATADELGPNAYAVEMDVTDQASIDNAIAAVIAQTGKLDILINNAALFHLAPIVDITRGSFERLFSINVAGTLFTLQAAARQMIGDAIALGALPRHVAAVVFDIDDTLLNNTDLRETMNRDGTGITLNEALHAN